MILILLLVHLCCSTIVFSLSALAPIISAIYNNKIKISKLTLFQKKFIHRVKNDFDSVFTNLGFFFHEDESWHSTDAVLLCGIFIFVNIDLQEHYFFHFTVHFFDLRSNYLARTAPKWERIILKYNFRFIRSNMLF